MIDFNLTEEQRLLQETARDFAINEIKPVADRVEQMDKAKKVPWDFCKGLVQKGTELGFMKLLIPEKYGGIGRKCIDSAILLEELAAADLGIAASYFAVTITSPMLILFGGSEEQRKNWLSQMCSADVHVLASAGNEPDVAGSDTLCPSFDPKIGLKTHAKKQGNEYVINGSKAAFCTNAGIAQAYFVMARTDLTKPAFQSTSLFYVPADTPGLSFGKKTDMLGWKTAHHTEVYLDDVRVSEGNRIGPEGANSFLFVMKCLPYFGTSLAACYTGLARATYEYALAYAKERISWGQPIIKHQAVAMKLADMLVDIQAARLMAWDAAVAVDTESHLANMKAISAKTFAVDVAIKTAENAVKILGGYGVAKEYLTTRYLADAWMGSSCDGTRDMLRLTMMNFVAPPEGGPPGPPPGPDGSPGVGGPPPGFEGPPPDAFTPPSGG